MKTRLFYFVSILNMLAFTFYLFSFTNKETNKVMNLEGKILKLKGLVIVDSLGIEHVIPR